MKFYVKNISKNFGMLLKHQVKPEDTLDLEAVFKEFSTETTNSRGTVIKPQFKSTEFKKFLDMVSQLANDKSKWEVVVNGEVEVKPKKTEPSPVVAVEVEALKQREIDPKHLSPQQIAWLPFDEKTRNFITEFNDVKTLKRSLNFVKNLHGKERLRSLIEDRVAELAESGI